MAAGPNNLVCVSWIPALSATRTLMLRDAGYDVVSACGRDEAQSACRAAQPALLILGHSVPRDEKRRLIALFRQASSAPVLSLLDQHQTKLPEADFGASIEQPAELVVKVREILG